MYKVTNMLCCLILSTLVVPCIGPHPDAFANSLPPGEPTFFAGNPNTRHLAFRYRVGTRLLGWPQNSGGVYGIFSQSSFWFLDNEDRGYTVESNYEPEVQLCIDADHLKKLSRFWPSNLDLGISYSHHSNGHNGILSRSWNHLNLGLYYGTTATNTVSGSLITWMPFNEEIGNKDIACFAGHGRLAVVLRPRQRVPWLGNTELYLASNYSFDGDLFTNLEASFSFTPRWLERPPFSGSGSPFALFIQWFVGTGESLINYQSHQNILRFGLRVM